MGEPELEGETAELAQMVEDYHKLDAEDYVGGLPTRFRYREVCLHPQSHIFSHSSFHRFLLMPCSPERTTAYCQQATGTCASITRTQLLLLGWLQVACAIAHSACHAQVKTLGIIAVEFKVSKLAMH